MLAGGVAAIFGPQSDTTSAHVQSICDTMTIPHIELRWDYREKRDQHSINLFPHPSKLGKAYLDIVTELKWTHFAILYENDEGLIRMQEILKAQSADPSPFSIILQELPKNGDFRPLLKDLWKRTVTRVVLDCSVGTVERVLKQAQQVGMMTDYHNYILTTLMNNSLVASVLDAWTSGSYLYSFGPGPGLTKESLTVSAAIHLSSVG
ncbi:unnamed protein product [Cyprideis torosa]|uniref:Uncharacterized protein n=1 Tax=Cyprideis torosa TaxID=163714 RepID=A0A7R8WUT3_9CRUS|nr:unnamed protein product [Cyprideis torosa]CAG0907065.1 unnamed protein product [Cyprideis torosa]